MPDKVLGDPVKGSVGGVGLLIGAIYLLLVVALCLLVYIIIFEIRLYRKLLYLGVLIGSLLIPGFVFLSIVGSVIWGGGIAAIRSGDYWLVGAVIAFAVSSLLGYLTLSNRETVFRYLWGPPLFSEYPL